MKRLIAKGLMFGDLIHVDSPVLIERYNRALEQLTGKRTDLTDFHIDIAGYSPEVGDALGDHLYLNANGVNRQFILLTPDQRHCPLLNAKFSTTHGILERFITDNEAQLFALTAGDAVAGELVNSVFTLSSPRRLFDLGRVRIEADTTRGALRHAEELGELVEQFKTREDGWFDDVLIAQMIEMAGVSGDVTRNPIHLSGTDVDQRNFWTAHFGGLYLFPHVDHPAVISSGDKAGLDDLPIKYVFAARERNRIAKFLDYNDLAEPIVKARGIDAAAILRQKMDFIVIDAAGSAGVNLTGLSRRDMRRIAREHAHALPREYTELNALLNWAEAGGKWPRITSEDPSYFYTLRAAQGPHHDLVNRLLAELSPLDFRQLFICHKELFYHLYAGWPEAKKTYVADFLEREYQVDKAGAREALFGHEPDMDNTAPHAPPEELIQRVGPWGAIRGR